MKVACLTFTYPRDAIKAYIGSQILPKNWDLFWVIDKKHEHMPVPNNVTKVITTFDRGTHLNGKDTIYGFVELLKMMTEKGYDIVLKLDSDTSLFNPLCFINPIIEGGSDFVYVRRYPSEYSVPIANGICYSFSKNCINKYLTNVDFKDLIMIHHGSEDSIISHYLVCLHPWPLISQVNKSLIDWSVQQSCQENTIAGHYGYKDVNYMLNRTNEILTKQGKENIPQDIINSNFVKQIDEFKTTYNFR